MLAALLSPAFVHAQEPLARFDAYTQLLSPEKLYLQTDREVYCAGDTVWFKAYLENASRLAEFPACNYVYVELIATMVEKNVNLDKYVEQESVRVRVKVKRRDGVLSGWLKIPDNLNTGVATLRGYSYWMLNREPEYMFHKDIELRNPMKDDYVGQMVQDEVREKNIYAEAGVADPFAKEKQDGKRKVDVQFLPESGRWMQGMTARLGIRAVDEAGHGIRTNGDIFADEEPVGRFETDAHGLGIVELTVAGPVKKVYAQVYDGDQFLAAVDLPRPEEQAAVITMSPVEGGMEARTSVRGLSLSDSTFLVVHDRDEIYLKIPYSEQTRRLKVPYDLLSPGINNLALVDDKGTVYAERAFFVFPEERADTPALSLDKASYGPRQRVLASLDLPEGDWSVAVTDDGYAPYSGKGYDLVSWWYLGSELPSFVEDSQRYFDPERPLEERIREMDKVMLTHGWTYYELPKILGGATIMPYFGKEYTQSLSGVVRGTLRTARKSIVSFVAPSIGFSAMGQLDTSGYFALNGLDFPEETQFLVAAVSLGGSTRRFIPILNDDVFARFHHYPAYLDASSYSQEYKYDMLKNYYDAGGEIVYSLHPSFITVSRPAAAVNISPLPDFEFKQGQFRSEQELEPYSALDLPTYIVTTCPPLRFGDQAPAAISMNGDGGTDDSNTDTSSEDMAQVEAPASSYRSIVCRVQKISSMMGQSSGWEEIIVFVNGMRSSCADLEGLMVSDITAFAYVHGADAIRFNADIGNALAPRSVIMIKTRMYAHDVASNVSTGKPLGWQQPKQFYNPRYEDLTSRRNPPVRPTLYWNPSLPVEAGQPATFDFFTSDHKADATVIVEGFTKEGVPLSIKGKINR